MRKLNRDLKIAIQFVKAVSKVNKLTAKEYALQSQTSLFFVQAIAARLVRGKVLLTQRGRGGGYRVNEQATLRDIFTALDSSGIVDEMLMILPELNERLAA